MHRRSEPEYVSEARRNLAAASKRLERQYARMDRICSEGRDASTAIRLYKVLQQRERRSEKYVDMVTGWHRAHPRVRFPRNLKTRFINPRAAQKQQKDRMARWNERVRAALDKQFPDAPHYKASVIALWEKYAELGLPNAHFVSELSSGKKEAFNQRVWEMMLARHLDALGYKVSTSDEGPDFLIEHEGKKIWIEAICPEPKGLPQHWLEGPKPGEFKVHDVPHNELLLRWTAAIKEKCEKFQRYREKGIVNADDACVIAVNGCQLGALPLGQGISQFPFALEAVYPAGPVAVPVDRNTGAFGTPFVSIRPEIETAKGKPVKTTVFLDKANSGVSAVIGFSGDRSDKAILPLDIIHNHFASSPIPKKVLGPENEEWGTEPDGNGGIDVKKIQAQATTSVAALAKPR